MRKTTLFLAVAALAMSACVRTATNEATGRTDVDVESPTKTGEDWSADVRGTAGFAQLMGTVKAKVVEGKTNVSFTLNGGTPGASHPWMVHEGTCAAPGAPFGMASAYTALTFGSDGRATVNMTLDGRLDEAKDYIVAVHASASDMTVVACGNLDD